VTLNIGDIGKVVFIFFIILHSLSSKLIYFNQS